MTDGWVLVPREPTEAMLVNGREALLPLVRLDSYGPLIGVWQDMLATAPAPPVDGWQPIETAPRDWSEYLIAWPSGAVCIGFWNSEMRYVDWHGSLKPDADQPSYWQTLPQPPNNERTG